MACVCIGGGGGCSVSSTTTEQYLSAFGYAYDPNNPQLPAIEQVLSASVPSGQGNVTAWKALARACLIARTLLYCKSTPGDCNTTPTGTKNALAGLQTAGQVSSLGISTGSSIATILGVGSTAAIGAATLGAGLALTVVLDVLEHHAAAEQTQATVLCNLCPQFSAGIQAVDAAVFSGQITAQQGEAYLQQLAQQFKSAVAPYTKTCNAFCGYGAIMSAMATYSSQLYQTGIRSALPGVTGLRALSAAPAPIYTASPVLVGSVPYQSPGNMLGQPPLFSQNPLSPSAPGSFYGYEAPGSYESYGGTAPGLAQQNLLSSIPIWAWIVIAFLAILAFTGGGRRAEAAA